MNSKLFTVTTCATVVMIKIIVKRTLIKVGAYVVLNQFYQDIFAVRNILSTIGFIIWNFIRIGQSNVVLVKA